MDRLIALNTVATGMGDTAPATGTPGEATDGNPATSTPATQFPAYAFNAIQAEMIAVILAAGLTPDKTNNAQLLAAIQKLGRIKLSANTTFYVNASTGSDSNNGLSSGTAWATIQHAYNVIANGYDLGGFAATIQLADGTYPAGLIASESIPGNTASVFSFPFVKSGIVINGNSVTPGNVIVSVTGGNVDAIQCIGGAHIHVQNLQVQAASGNGLSVIGDSALSFSNIIFGTCGNDHCYVDTAAFLGCAGNYSISGNAQNHIFGKRSGIFGGASAIVTITAPVSFSSAFVFADILSNITPPVSYVNPSNVTGKRYTADRNAVIDTNGGGATVLPGTVAGTATNGAYYS